MGAAQTAGDRDLVSTMAKIESFSKTLVSRLAMAVAAASAGLLLAPAAEAQQLNSGAGGPNITPGSSSTNGAPIVNIVTPNSAGVSHNVYTDFNVGQPGLVLNNSKTGTEKSTLTGTALTANSNLTGDAAKLILNEVTGSANPSTLAGYIEIYGAKADFILANPGGVTCDGCGFINTPRATLTTGTPNLDGTGALTGFTVNGGNVTVQGSGADINGLQYFDVVARSISLQGTIKDSAATTSAPNNTGVRLTAGRNSYDYASRQETALADDGSAKPAFGIDSTALGGAQAGKISLVSTEKGLGINTPADMQAAYNGIDVSADGKIVFGGQNSQGTIKARGTQGITANSKSGDIQIKSKVWSQSSLKLTAAGTISVDSKAAATAQGDVTANAQSLALYSGALLGAGLGENGNSGSSGTLAVQASQVSNAGTLTSASLTKLDGGTLTNSGTVTSQGDTAITLSGDAANTNTISGQTVTLNAGGTFGNQAGASVTSASSTALNVGSLTNGGSVSSQGSTSANAAGAFTNLAGASVTSVSGTALTAGTLTNSGTLSSQAGLAGNVSGDLSNAGSISGQQVKLTTGGALANQAGGQLASTQDMTLSSKALTNAGGIAAGTKLTAVTAADLTNTGQITAQQDAALTVGGTLSNDIHAKINAGGTLSINATKLKNFGGADILMPRGEISSLYLVINSGDVMNAGNLFATQDLTINSTGNMVNSFGWIKAGNYVSITAAGNLDNIVGLIQGKSANFSAQTMENVVLVRPDDELLLPRKLSNVIRTLTTQNVAQAVAGWDKAVLVRFGTTDNKALDTLRLQLGDSFLLQQQLQQKQPGKGAANVPQPGQAAKSKHTDVAAARPAAF